MSRMGLSIHFYEHNISWGDSIFAKDKMGNCQTRLIFVFHSHSNSNSNSNWHASMNLLLQMNVGIQKGVIILHVQNVSHGNYSHFMFRTKIRPNEARCQEQNTLTTKWTTYFWYVFISASFIFRFFRSFFFSFFFFSLCSSFFNRFLCVYAVCFCRKICSSLSFIHSFFFTSNNS